LKFLDNDRDDDRDKDRDDDENHQHRTLSSCSGVLSDKGAIFFITSDTVEATGASTVWLSDSAFQNVTGSTTFRLYAFNAESTGGGWSVDNVTLVGTVEEKASGTMILIR
jgi:hypothetical protein